MDQNDRDLLITVNQQVASLCRSVDELRNRIETTYATKDWVDNRISCKYEQMQETAISPIQSFFNSKGGMAILIVVGLLALLGFSALTSSGEMSQQDIIDIIQSQLGAQ